MRILPYTRVQITETMAIPKAIAPAALKGLYSRVRALFSTRATHKGTHG